MYSGLGGKEDNTKLSRNTGEKSKFVLLEFINFELVIQPESEKQPGNNKSTIASYYCDNAFRLIKHLTLHMISSENRATFKKRLLQQLSG